MDSYPHHHYHHQHQHQLQDSNQTKYSSVLNQNAHHDNMNNRYLLHNNSNHNFQTKFNDIIPDISQLFQSTDNDILFTNDPMLHASKSFEENNLMPSITTDFVFNYSDIELKNSPIDDYDNIIHSNKPSESCQTSSPDNLNFNASSSNSSDNSESTCHSVLSCVSSNKKRRKLSEHHSPSIAEMKQEPIQDERPRAITFTPWNVESWADIYDSNYNKIDAPEYKVEADKGFFFSKFDDSFVCQKKNHFQITTHTTLKREPVYCKLNGTFYTIDKVCLQIYGMKKESNLQRIEIRQSDTDRKQMDYEPIECHFKENQTLKTTKMRLHFAHTTSNNNRKKNLPNPDQRYFLLVVEMQIILKETNRVLILCSAVSDRVIVRAVNPGQFKNQEAHTEKANNNSSNSTTNGTNQVEDGVINDEASAQVSATTVSMDKNLCIFGKMGINTGKLDESLNVVGNLKLSGNVLQPSDMRVKEKILEVNPQESLAKIAKLKLYQYDYKSEYIDLNGGVKSDYGVLAQELKEIIPEAVVETGDLALTNGDLIDKFLHVNKNRLNMECVGAVIALNDKTQSLDDKIVYIERILDPAKKKDENLCLDYDANKLTSPSIDYKALKHTKYLSSKSRFKFLKTRLFKIIVSMCLLIIALAIAGILTVQILHHVSLNNNKNLMSNNTNNQYKINQLINYPMIISPNQVVSKPCDLPTNSSNDSISDQSCSFCCDTDTFGTTPAPSFLKPIKLLRNNLNNTYEKINQTLMSPLFRIILFSSSANIYFNLSMYGECTSYYCEEIDGDDYFYIPISKTIPVNTNHFYFIFLVKQGYSFSYCSRPEASVLCSEAKLFNQSSIFNITSLNSVLYSNMYSYTSQIVYYMPINYFLSIDYKFRLTSYFSGRNDTCSSTNKLYKDYTFRFYRKCN